MMSVPVPTNTAKSAPFVWVQANHLQAFNTGSLSVQGCSKNRFCDPLASIRLMMPVLVPTNTAKSAPFVWVQANHLQAFNTGPLSVQGCAKNWFVILESVLGSSCQFWC